MPQLDPATFAPQLIWLAISFIVLYLLMKTVGLPKIGRVIDQRRARIGGDLEQAATAKHDAEAVLAAYEPQHPAYVALKAKLAELRAGKEATGRPSIPNGPALKIGMQDERVPQLRETLLRVRGDATTYDKELAEAVKKFLTGKGIEANRVYTEGKGSKQPVADNKTAEGRAKNRRVEVEVVGTRAKK